MYQHNQNTYLNIQNILDLESIPDSWTSVNLPSFNDTSVIIDVIKNEYMNKLIISNKLKVNKLKKTYNSIINDILPNFVSFFDNDSFDLILKENPKVFETFLNDFDDTFSFYSSEYKPVIDTIKKEIDVSYQIITELLKIIIELDKMVKNNYQAGIKQWIQNFTTLLALDYRYNVLNESIMHELEELENSTECDWDYSLLVLNNVNNNFLYGEDIWSLMVIDNQDPKTNDYTELNKVMNFQFDQIQSCFFFIDESFIDLDEDKMYFNNIFSEFLKIFMGIQQITNSKEISSKKLSDFKIAISHLNNNTTKHSQIDDCLSTIIEIVCGKKDTNDFSSTLIEKVNYYNFFKNCILLPKLFHLSSKLNISDPENVTSSFFETLVKTGYSALVSNQCYHMSFLKHKNSNSSKTAGINNFISDLILANCCPCCKYLNLLKSKANNIFDVSYIVRNVAPNISHIDNTSLVEISLSKNIKELIENRIMCYNNLMDIEQYKRFNENMRQLLGYQDISFHITLDLNLASNEEEGVPINYLKNKNESLKKIWTALNPNKKLTSTDDITLSLIVNKADLNRELRTNDKTSELLDKEIEEEITHLLKTTIVLLADNQLTLNHNSIIPLLKKNVHKMLIAAEDTKDCEYSRAYLA